MTPQEVLKEIGILTDQAAGNSKPSVRTLAVSDGTFIGLGALRLDSIKNEIVLLRPADNIGLLTNNRPDMSAEEYEALRLPSGIHGISTYGLEGAEQGYWGSDRGVLGFFRVPVPEVLDMAGQGQLILGRPGDGELVANPMMLGRYLAEVRENRFRFETIPTPPVRLGAPAFPVLTCA